MGNPAEELLESIRIILRVFTVDETRFPSAEGRIKYNPVDFQTLYFLSANPGCMSRELADFLGVSPTTAQSVCDRLIKRGFVQRGRSATSGRATALSLTEEGESIVGAIRRQDLSNCEMMLDALPKQKRDGFAAQMRLIAESVSRID